MEATEVAMSEIVHGSIDYAELERLGLQADDIVDFSVNANPYRPSSKVREALTCVALDRYPDRACLQLRRLLLTHELASSHIAPDQLLCGNGSSELIWLIARAFLREGDCAAIIGPTFAEYAVASRMAGARIVELRASEDSDFAHRPAQLLDWMWRVRPRLLWLCNPNNPNGKYLDTEDLELLVQACADLDTLLIIDESYRHFVVFDQDSAQLLFASQDRHICDHMLIVRSLTMLWSCVSK
jgi:histidinol-phosphate aminotransferase